MSELNRKLVEARDEVARLERAVAGATCSEVGCDMQQLGGRNAGCSDICGCSVPVHVCSRCGDSDYGDNEEAGSIMRRCDEMAAEDARP